ncbi:MAG: DUF11 domain-containing protein [Candidatus Magnetomorum sp.]|nr:DUF11 domain-containing protein [Candidatus Magnetomorum sp.]
MNKKKFQKNYRIFLFILMTLSFQPFNSYADPYPPYWENGRGASIHYPVLSWPGDLQWNYYTLNGLPIKDPRDKDTSNGGTSPQSYVNVTSGCQDLQEGSVFWWFDSVHRTIFFRWRVEAIANTYATGPKSGAYSSSDPWSSALYTVFFDIDGDGFREFAMFLNGSSGSPSNAIDVLVSIYSNTDSQSIDWETEGIYKLFHNPTAFVDPKTDMILNFQSTLTPIASWPNGKNETSWDYGSTRAIALSGCGEYFIDYQIPLDMFDASHVGGPKMTENSPFSMIFATANSLNNPLQKDLVYVGDLLGDPSQPTSFGDMITFKSGPVVQPFIISIHVEGCQPVAINAEIRDAFDCSSDTCQTSVSEVKFYGYLDTNQNTLPDDNNEWFLITEGTHSTDDLWGADWDVSQVAVGQYLIGAKATDAEGNTTWGYLSETDVKNLLGGHPNYANLTPNPGVVYGAINNDCGAGQETADLEILKTVDNPVPETLDTIVYTILLSNHGPDTATHITITDILPSGLEFVAASSNSYTPGTGIWQITDLPPDNQTSLRLTMTVLETSEGMRITNTSRIDALTETDTNASNNFSFAAITVQQKPYLDLDIQKTVDRAVAKPGDILQYQIILKNTGPIDATAISVKDLLPDPLIFISSDSLDYTASSGLWRIKHLAVGETRTLAIQAQINSETTLSPIINTAHIENVLEIDTNTTNDKASVQTVISTSQISADLSLQKMSSKTIVSSGDMICYTLIAQNNGPDAVSDASVFDQLPASLSYVQHTTAQGQYYSYSHLWTVGAMDINQTAVLFLCTQLDFNGIPGDVIVNQANIQSSTISDPQLSNNIAETSVIRGGLHLRPNHEITTTSGSQIVFSHTISILSGDHAGELSIGLSSSQTISWSIIYDVNNNKLLDATDTIWTHPQSVSSMSGTFFIRAYLSDYVPAGWMDSTVITAKYVVSDQTFIQSVTDITHVIGSDIGKMQGIKTLAIDTDCDTQLDDESIENKTFETSKAIAPGECGIYRILFSNKGTGALSNVIIEDQTPDFSIFIGGSAVAESLPAGLTLGEIKTPVDNGAGVIIWPFDGSLLPGLSGTVRYEVKIGM